MVKNQTILVGEAISLPPQKRFVSGWLNGKNVGYLYEFAEPFI